MTSETTDKRTLGALALVAPQASGVIPGVRVRGVSMSKQIISVRRPVMMTWDRACRRAGNATTSTWGQAFRNGWLDAGNGIRLRIALTDPDGQYRSGYWWGQHNFHEEAARIRDWSPFDQIARDAGVVS